MPTLKKSEVRLGQASTASTIVTTQINTLDIRIKRLGLMDLNALTPANKTTSGEDITKIEKTP